MVTLTQSSPDQPDHLSTWGHFATGGPETAVSTWQAVSGPSSRKEASAVLRSWSHADAVTTWARFPDHTASQAPRQGR